MVFIKPGIGELPAHCSIDLLSIEQVTLIKILIVNKHKQVGLSSDKEIDNLLVRYLTPRNNSFGII